MQFCTGQDLKERERGRKSRRKRRERRRKNT
jgi:hypothetical protein